MKTSGLASACALMVGLSFAASEARAELLFEDQPDKLGAPGCGGEGCWTNHVRIVDFDGDGDLDLVFVNCEGFFDPPAALEPLKLFANDGAGNFTDASSAMGTFSGRLRQVAFGDIDGDGDLDMHGPDANGQADKLFINNGGSFTDEASTRLPGLGSSAGATRFGDVDNDGDLDLIVTDGYVDTTADPAHLYLNDGTGIFTEAAGALPTQKFGINPDDVDLADVDGDFDLDIYVNMHNDENSLWINDGTGSFSDASASLPNLGSGSLYHYGPVFCDVDGDGDRDLLIDNTGGGYLEQLLINDGSGDFTDETNRITGNVSGADDNIVTCIDHDNDGDFDIVVGALGPGQERLFVNDGSGNFSRVQEAFNGPQDSTLWIDFGDLNGDGRLDAITGQGEFGIKIERVYFGNASVPADNRGPVITATESVTLSATDPTTVRFAVSDNAVTDDGPRLSRAFVQVGAAEIEATFMGGDIYRAVIPPTPETTFNPCAVDLAGNATTGCPGGTGEGGGGGGTTTGTTGTMGPGSGGGSNTGGQNAGGDGSGGGSGGDSGCSCSVPGDGRGRSPLLFLGFALAGIAVVSRARRSVRG